MHLGDQTDRGQRVAFVKIPGSEATSSLLVFRDFVELAQPGRGTGRIWRDLGTESMQAVSNWQCASWVFQSPFVLRNKRVVRDDASHCSMTADGIGDPQLNKYFVDLVASPGIVLAWLLMKSCATRRKHNSAVKDNAQGACATLITKLLAGVDVQVSPQLVLSIGGSGCVDASRLIGESIAECSGGRMEHRSALQAFQAKWQTLQSDPASYPWLAACEISNCPIGAAVVCAADFFGFEYCTSGTPNMLTSMLSAIAGGWEYRALQIQMQSGTAGNIPNQPLFFTRTGKLQTGAKLCQDNAYI